MSPSSLIFVVVLLIWATYLALHVTRRREQVSTARSVDRFSAQMRVLQRRSVKAVARSASLTSSGSAHSSILAAGARVAAPVPATPEVSASTASTAGATGRPGGRASRLAEGRPAEGRPAASAGARAATAVRAGRAFGAWGVLTGLNPRRLRAYALLCSAATALIAFPLAALQVIGWALPGVAAATTFALLAWLRHDRRAVVAARARRATAARLARERAEAEAARERELRSLDEAAAAAQARPETPRMPVAQEYVEPRRAPLFDVAAFEEAPRPAAPSRPAVDPLVAERGWEPVPVPRPTYTMKARAEHPLPPALEAPVPIEVMDDFEQEFWEQDARAVGH